MDSTTGQTGTSTSAYLECLNQAAIETLNATCGVQLTPSPDATVQSEGGVIIAFISLVGDVDWSMFLSLPRQTATELAAKFAGFEVPFDSDDMGDAIGELTNILAGTVKISLDRKGVTANISLPSVIRAEGLSVLHQRGIEVAKTCFDTSLGALWTGVMAQTQTAA